MDTSKIQDWVQGEVGLHFDRVGQLGFNDLVNSRMIQRGCQTPAEYLQILKNESREFSGLVNTLTVNETYFFREHQHFEILTDQLVPALGERNPIRILCAGCSTGEEPYSIAMALIERFGMSIMGRVMIIGVDIDSNAIEVAKRACYRPNAFRSFDQQQYGHYFSPIVNGTRCIDKDIKDKVKFLLFNLLTTPYPITLCQIDIIFYRNLSIYFHEDTRRKVFDQLASILNPDGTLIVGLSEIHAHDYGRLTLVRHANAFYFQNTRRTQQQVKNSPAPEPNRSQLIMRLENAIGHSHFELGHSLIKDCRRYFNDPYPIMFMRALIYACEGQTDRATADCNEVLRTDPFNLDGMLLLGLIKESENAVLDALDQFRRCIYVDGSCWLAHYHLAEIYRSMRKYKASIREYRLTIKHLNAPQGFNPLLIQRPNPHTDITLACEEWLEKMARFLE